MLGVSYVMTFYVDACTCALVYFQFHPQSVGRSVGLSIPALRLGTLVPRQKLSGDTYSYLIAVSSVLWCTLYCGALCTLYCGELSTAVRSVLRCALYCDVLCSVLRSVLWHGALTLCCVLIM